MGPMDNLIAKAEVLVESLPYIRKFAGKTFVIKYGGQAMINEELKNKVMVDLIMLKYIGINPILVHGGGKEITEWSKRVGLKTEFIQGLRVTDAETMELAEMVLMGKVNREIVSMINRHGGKAVGLNGRDADLLISYRLPPKKIMVDGKIVKADLGFVGGVYKVNTDILDSLISQDYIPVVSSIGISERGEDAFNINADSVAGELAAALKAEKLILLTDVEAISDGNGNGDGGSGKRISRLDRETAVRMMEDGRINSGMIPKVKACFKALESGVNRTHIIDGRIDHALLLEIFTDKGIGTMVV